MVSVSTQAGSTWILATNDRAFGRYAYFSSFILS
jgi:hypothetical protein